MSNLVVKSIMIDYEFVMVARVCAKTRRYIHASFTYYYNLQYNSDGFLQLVPAK